MLTVAQTAARLGLTERGVTKHIERGTLPAQRFGRAWMIDPADLAAFQAQRRPRGRPGHAASASTPSA